MYKIVFLSVLMLCSITASAQVYFERGLDYNNLANGFWGNTVADSSGYYVAAFATDFTNQSSMILYKVGIEGEILDTMSYTKTGIRFYPTGLYSSLGNLFIISDYTDSYNGVAFSKMKKDGTVYFDTAYKFTPYRFYTQASIRYKPDRILVTGQRADSALTSSDGFSILIDTSGNVISFNIFGGNGFDGLQSASATSDGGFLLLGWTRSFGAGQRDFYLIKTDSLGNQQWQKTYGSSNDELGLGITQKSDGNFILTGIGGNTSYSRGIIRVVDTDGITLWTRQYTYENEDQNLYWTYELADGSLISVGLTNSDNAGYLQKTDSEGNLIWQHKYNYNDNTDLFYNVLPTTDGGFLLSGQCANDTTGQDAWLLKVDSFGCPYPNCTVAIAEENKTVAFNMWPSPATETLNIDIESFALNNTTLYITDLSGRKVLEYCPTQKLAQLDISKFASGVYFLHLQTATQNTRVKFVKE